jgi:hypothetical protein
VDARAIHGVARIPGAHVAILTIDTSTQHAAASTAHAGHAANAARATPAAHAARTDVSTYTACAAGAAHAACTCVSTYTACAAGAARAACTCVSTYTACAATTFGGTYGRTGAAGIIAVEKPVRVVVSVVFAVSGFGTFDAETAR